jgi:signal recognition particle subunit SRP54
MFDNLSERLQKTFKNIRGQGRLTEDNIKDALREVRRALLEADVALEVIKSFIDQVQTRAVGQEVALSLTPGQAFIKIVKEELTQIMGQENFALKLNAVPPAVILMAGLQGAGKTTTVGKLARFLREREKKKVLVVSADVYRPAAIAQLKTLAEQVGVSFFPSEASQSPVKIAKDALDSARKQFFDVLIVDTAGRLHIDVEMMDEVKAIHSAINPIETLFVVDAMTGQDAAKTAKAFNEALPLTGAILTKTDGDARGGAALSLRSLTGKPIKFLGAGEKLDALEPFFPERMASRILGMGDVLSLIEQVEHKVDRVQAEKLAKKLHEGESFTFEDFKAQLQQIQNMGGVFSMLDKLPGMGGIANKVDAVQGEKQFKRIEAIINSMTLQERRHPSIIKGSRKRRIAQGSGTSVQEINRLMKQFEEMQKMMKSMKKGGMKNMMRAMGGMGAMGGAGGMAGGLGGMMGKLPFGKR